MNSKNTMHTEKVVAEYFQIQSKFLSTRVADAYKAVDLSRNSQVTLWLSKESFELDSPSVSLFLETMQKIKDIRPPLSELIAYGVDPAGIAFALFPPLDGKSIAAGNIEASEAERRFMSCAQMVNRLHSIGTPVGDLCSSSFWISRSGGLSMTSLMGTSEQLENADTRIPIETLPYFAPGQITGRPNLESDIFSLGVLGYYLFTHTYPYGEGEELLTKSYDISSVKPLSDFISVPPIWADDIIKKCLDPVATNRYRSASELLAAIKESKERSIAGQNLPQPTRSGAPKVGKRAGSSIEEFSTASNLPVSAYQSPEKVKSRKVLYGAVILTALLIATIIPFLFKDRSQEEKNVLEEELLIHRAAVTDENLKEAIDTISEGDNGLEAKASQLKKVSESNDPLAHDILMKSARESQNQKMRDLSEKALVERVRRVGLTRTAEQVRQWLRTLRAGQYPQNYIPLLRSTNTSIPLDARFSEIRQAYTAEPLIALRVATALAIDLKSLDEFQPLLSQLVGDALEEKGMKKHSTLSLILAHPDLALIFGEDVIQSKDRLPSSDILWLLKILAKRNDINVRAIASLGVERDVLSSIKRFFLQMIRDRADLPPDVMRSLIRASAGVLDKQDVKSFGRWYDIAAEKVLLALLIDTKNIDLQKEIFDTLAGKSLTLEPSASLIKWIRTNYWEDRTDFAGVVGVLGNIDKLSDKEILEAFTAFDDAARDSDLLDILLDTNHPTVVKAVVSKYSDLLGLGTLLNLLDFQDKSVRKTAVRSLREFNDIGALKLIIDYYEKEKDEEVRKVYQNTFWVIKKREEDGTKGFGF